MPKVFTSEKQKIGEIGENIATRFLVKHGYSIIDRNYTKKWGEIDIIAEKDSKLYFIEVKSVSRMPAEALAKAKITPPSDVKRETFYKNVSRETLKNLDNYRAEDNMHPWKLKRLSRTIQTYLMSNRIPENKEWQVDLLIVYLDLKNKKAKVKIVPDIVL